MKSYLSLILSCFFLVLFSRCTEEGPDASITSYEGDIQTIEEDPPYDIAEIKALLLQADASEGGAKNLRRKNSVVSLPAGSVDALEDAIMAAGEGGTVVLKSGLHTETNMVTVPFGLNILGESGAVLQVDSDPEFFGGPPLTVDPALYLYEADHTLIWGIQLQPPASKTGGTAILVQNSKRVVVANNVISNHQVSIMLENGDYANIWENNIHASAVWRTSNGAFTQGIVVVNAEQNKIVKNDITDGFLGVWACDKDSKMIHNTIKNGSIGLLLCKVRDNNYLLPDGTITGAESSATNWQVVQNSSGGNLFGGYVVIDGANGNQLVNNAANDNGVYDIELVGDSQRFGFFTTSSFNNTVVSAKYKNLVIKDCGTNNRVLGAPVIDNTADPCF